MSQRAIGALFLLLAVPAASQTREQAVAAAREGRLDEGIAILESLLAGGDQSRETAFDLAVILARAKRPKEATDLFERTDSVEAPEYVLLAMTRAYWDQRRNDAGLRLAREGLERFPDNVTWFKLNGLIGGEAAERSGDLFTGLRLYEDARRKIPDDHDLIAACAGVLARLGAPHAAASTLAKTDAGLEAQKAGLMVRWGTDVRLSDPLRRYEGTDAALARLDLLIAAAAGGEAPDLGLVTRLRRDRVVALRDRERWLEAVQQVDELHRDGDHVPLYVREAEADALLGLRRPEEARRAYSEILAADPRNEQALVGRFYAEIETEDFRAAFATIDALAHADSTYRVASGQARGYADMNAEAWRRLAPLSRQAPALAYLRVGLGDVAAARGWTRRAAEEVEIAASLAPGDLGVRVALADSALRMRRYAEARRRAAALMDVYGGEAAVKRLADEVRRFGEAELRTEFHGNIEANGVNASPGPGFESSTRLYSPPLADRWRILGGFDLSVANPIEGWVHRYRTGGGIEWRLPSWTVEATGWSNTGTLHRGGAQLEINWKLNDRWNVSANGQLFSTEVPLRALLYGVTGNSASFGAGYDWNESRGWAANATLANFSDGNRRRAGGYHFVQRITDRPHLKLTLRPAVYTSTNSRVGAPYFNPSRDSSGFVSVEAEQILSRRYERSFRHQFSAGGGAYWQRSYSTGAIASVSYEQIFQFSPITELRYGATYARSLYDGAPVNSYTLSIAIARRF